MSDSNGIRMNDPTDIPVDVDEFQRRLAYSVRKWKDEGRRGCWIKLTKPLFHHLSCCVSLGFNVHHGNEQYVMLEQWLSVDREESMIPQYAYSYIGAHAVILNDRNQLVVMKEHYRNQQWKLPGGAVDVGEHASTAAVREAKEETGLDCEFMGVLSVRHLLDFRFGNTCDISMICVLKPKDSKQEFNPLHLNEVKDVQWMDVDQFIASEKHVFFGSEQENLNILKAASIWMSTHWDDPHSKEAQRDNPCFQKFKQTHPFRENAEIALYHR